MDPAIPGYGLIKRAIILENEQRYINSLACYQEGLDILLQVLNSKLFFKIFVLYWT